MIFSLFFIFTTSSANFEFCSYDISSLVLGYMRDSVVSHSQKSQCFAPQCFHLHDQNIALGFCNVVDTIATAYTPHLQYFGWHFTFLYLLNSLTAELDASLEAIFK